MPTKYKRKKKVVKRLPSQNQILYNLLLRHLTKSKRRRRKRTIMNELPGDTYHVNQRLAIEAGEKGLANE